MDQLSHKLHQLSSQPAILLWFNESVYVLPNNISISTRGQMQQGLLSPSLDSTHWRCSLYTYGLLRCRSESPFLSFQAADKLFSPKVYLLTSLGSFVCLGPIMGTARDKRREDAKRFFDSSVKMKFHFYKRSKNSTGFPPLICHVNNLEKLYASIIRRNNCAYN